VIRKFYDLDSRVVAGLNTQGPGHNDVFHANSARVRPVGRTEELPRLHERSGVVQGTTIGAVGVDADVDVEKGRSMTREPAGLEGDCAACRGPVGPIP
jgi:hypothetical protein